MDVQAIFGLQFILSLVAWGVIAAVLIAPWLAGKSPREALIWLSLPHAFRHIGMAFLVPGLVTQALPTEFSYPAAFGDLAAGVIALVTIVALHRKWAVAVGLAWLLNVVGTVDLFNALRHLDVATEFRATWFIPTMLVPLLLVTHAMMFKRLGSV